MIALFVVASQKFRELAGDLAFEMQAEAGMSVVKVVMQVGDASQRVGEIVAYDLGVHERMSVRLSGYGTERIATMQCACAASADGNGCRRPASMRV